MMGIRVPLRPPETPEEMEQQITLLERSIFRTRMLLATCLASGAVLLVVLVIAWIIGLA